MTFTRNGGWLIGVRLEGGMDGINIWGIAVKMALHSSFFFLEQKKSFLGGV